MTERIDKFEQFLRDGGTTGRALSDDTVETYLRVAGLLERHRGKLAKVLRSDLSSNTKLKYLAGLRQWAVFAKDKDLQGRLKPGAGLQRLLKPRESKLQEHIEAFTDEEMHALLEAAEQFRGGPPRWVWPCVSLQANLALRAKADLAGLRRRAVESALESGRLAVMGKRGRVDQLPARFVADELRELLAAGEGTSWTIVADLISPETCDQSENEHRNAAYRVYRRVLIRLGEEAGVDAGRTHRIRHWSITRYHREVARGDIVRTKRFARHENLETTLGYIRAVDIGEDDVRLAEIKRIR